MTFPSLNDLIKSYSTTFLLEQYIYKKDEYTQEAINIIEQELKNRNIDSNQIEEYKKKGVFESLDSNDIKIRRLKRDDFIKLEGAFTQTDAYAVRAMFEQENIPFFIDASLEYLPVINEQKDSHPIKIFVHKDEKDKALAFINEHFDLTDGKYHIKYSDIKERLSSLNFNEIAHVDLEKAEITEVKFSDEEKNLIIHFGSRLLKEIDEIESHQEKIVFFFDNIEHLIKILSQNQYKLTKADLMTVLEILQIYCRDDEFDKTAEEIARALLSFFFGN